MENTSTVYRPHRWLISDLCGARTCAEKNCTDHTHNCATVLLTCVYARSVEIPDHITGADPSGVLRLKFYDARAGGHDVLSGLLECSQYMGSTRIVRTDGDEHLGGWIFHSSQISRIVWPELNYAHDHMGDKEAPTIDVEISFKLGEYHSTLPPMKKNLPSPPETNICGPREKMLEISGGC